jgi:tetratricopeptide (TPR) repeat protein
VIGAAVALLRSRSRRTDAGIRGRLWRCGFAPAATLSALVLAGAGSVGCAEGTNHRGDPGYAELVAAGSSDRWAQLLARQPGCAPAAAQGLDAAALGLAGLDDAHAGPAALRGGDIEALAALVDGLAGPDAGIGVVREGPVPADAEVAGAGICTVLDPAWSAFSPAARSVRRIPISPDVQGRLDQGVAAMAAGKAPEARLAFAAAARAEPAAPGPALAIARSYATEQRWAEAVAAFSDLVPRFPRTPALYQGLGDALRGAGRRAEAADAWARALALDPRAHELQRQVATDPYVEVRPVVLPPAVRAADGHWILLRGRDVRERGDRRISPEAAAAALGEAQAYAACKEAFRRSADLQVALLGEALSPWRWSAQEEAACTAVWLRAYQRNRDTGRPEDDGLDDLVAIAKAGFLVERALFDVGVRVHPLATAILGDRAVARLFTFVAAHRVLHRRQGGWLL